uniref:CHK kinase-like domain-containing protein n=1 Tax=Panagrolaimus sp. PS1159 TaxID=55785 RepID=A0AC35G4I2_9BILA
MTPATVLPKVDGKQKLCDSDFTIEWLLNSLIKNDKKFAKGHGHRKVSNVSARDISGGKGMFSIVLKCEISFQDSKDEKDIYTTIVKIPGTDAWEMASGGKKNIDDMIFAGKNLVEGIVEMHKTECDFYEIIGQHVSEIIPRVFQAQEWKIGKHQGCLHMEDLSKTGKNLDFYHSLSHGQLKNIVKSLAYFHKNIICLNENNWKGKFLSQKRVFIEIIPMLKDFSLKFLEMAKKTTALQEIFQNPKLQKIMFDEKYIEYALIQSYKDVGIPDLLVHADLWSSNIIFVADENGNPTDKISAILDWQVLHEGNMLLDFVRLMLNSLDGDTRREAELYVFDFYIEELNKCLAEVGKKAPFSVEQVKRAYEYLFVGHCAHTLMMPAAIFGSKIPKIGEEKAQEARIDKCALRALHVLEDALALIETGKFNEWLE